MKLTPAWLAIELNYLMKKLLESEFERGKLTAQLEGSLSAAIVTAFEKTVQEEVEDRLGAIMAEELGNMKSPNLAFISDVIQVGTVGEGESIPDGTED